MARTRRVKFTRMGVTTYHLMSRTNDKRFLFEKGKVKSELIEALRRAADFSGVKIKAYVAMSNHFHVVVRVTRTEALIPEAELIRRVGVLNGAAAAEALALRWENLHAAGFEATLKEEQDKLRHRMNDISEFMKSFKELFDRWYKRDQAYCGSLWSGRFKSTIVQDGEYLARCIRYILLNPIRAGIVTQIKDYKWCWSENAVETYKNEVNEGAVPSEEWGRVRVAQIGAGVIFGSEAFVRETGYALGGCFYARSLSVRGVSVRGASKQSGSLKGSSSHGWRLAKAASKDEI